MLSRAAAICLLSAVFAAPAFSQPPITQPGTQLMPGVTFDKTVEFTPHGAVVLSVLTAPEPGSQGGLYQLTPVLSHGLVAAAPERVTQMEKDASASATVAGIDGDLFSQATGHPSGILISGGVLVDAPNPGRSAIGVDASGLLHVDRVKFFGTWKGTGQREPLTSINQTPLSGQVVLFTPTYGVKTPVLPGSAEAVVEPFPAAVPNTDLPATVTAVATGGGVPIPADGAVLMATGARVAVLQAEAGVGTPVTTRLILQPDWTGVGAGLGGGPVLVRGGKAVFRSNEDFTDDQIAARTARAGVGQLADGRVILVAVDGDQPGYSVGMTSFELAQTMVRLGAVTASALDSGTSVTAAFDGHLLDRPSDPSGERPVREALLVEYFGVYAPPPPLPLVNGDPGSASETLSYKLVRPSTVTTELIGPGGATQVLENAVAHPPGGYQFTASALPVEGTWRFDVSAKDDLGRVSSAEQTFRYDTTLRGLTTAAVATGTATIRFTLTRAASVSLHIETPGGIVVRTLPAQSLTAGAQRLVWDGSLDAGTRATSGNYVADVVVTSSVGTSDLSAPFAFRRG